MLKISKTDVLTGVSCAGVFLTAVLAADAGYRARPILEECKEEPIEEKVKKTWKYFVLAGAAAGGTAVGIIGSHKLSTAQIASLMGTCAYLAKNRDKLEQKIREYVDVDKAKQIIQEARKETVAELPKKDDAKKHQTYEETGYGDLLVIEGYSGRMFRSSKEAVDKALKEWAEEFESGEYVCYNDLYRKLNIELSHFGEQWGYAANSDFYDGTINYETNMVYDDKKYGEDVYIIDIYTYAMQDWNEV